MPRLLGRSLAELGVHTGAKSAGQIFADMNFALGERAMEVLRIGVDGDEFDAAHLRRNHVIDCVFARATDADHADSCERLNLWYNAFRHMGECAGYDSRSKQYANIDNL